MFGYSEPVRRFIQREGFEPQANEIPNTMPSWMPGKDYYTDFHKGDPFVKVDQGFARLPGAGYAALHPELEDVNPEDYPDIHKMAILADVAPYSREYNTRDFHPARQQEPHARAGEASGLHVQVMLGKADGDLRPAAQQKPHARAGEASGLHVQVMLGKADCYLPGTRL